MNIEVMHAGSVDHYVVHVEGGGLFKAPETSGKVLLSCFKRFSFWMGGYLIGNDRLEQFDES